MKSTKAFDRVRLARANGRPTSLDYISHLFTDFTELHGDRYFADDAAIVETIGKCQLVVVRQSEIVVNGEIP